MLRLSDQSFILKIFSPFSEPRNGPCLRVLGASEDKAGTAFTIAGALVFRKLLKSSFCEPFASLVQPRDVCLF